MSTFHQPALNRWRAMPLLLALATTYSAADDRPDIAVDVGTNPPNVIRFDSVGTGDYSDFLKFTITENRTTQITLSQLTGDADLYLRGDNGLWRASRRRGYGLDESISRTLTPGTYTVQIYAWTGRVNYRFQLSTQRPAQPGNELLPPIDGMNGVAASVEAVGTIAPNTSYIDYHFNLPAPRLISVQGPANVGAGITPDTNPVRWNILQNGRLDDVRLNAGPHYLRVFRNATQTVNFRFTITAKPLNTGDTAGYDTATARNLGVIGNPPTIIDEYVGQNDFDDYYKVWVRPNSQLNVALNHRFGSQNADVWVYDPLGTVIGQSTNAGSASENISVPALVAGTYHVRVGIADRSGPDWENANYTVAIGTVPASISVPRPAPAPQPAPGPFRPADAGNRIGSDATPFGGPTVGTFLPSGPLTEGETVGAAGDPEDWYSFTLSCNISSYRPVFSITNTGAVTVQVYQAYNGSLNDTRLLPIAPVNAQGQAQVDPILQVGNGIYEFYLRVQPSGPGVANYTVTGERMNCQS